MLFVIGIPIGNLQDITVRAMETLRTLNFLVTESIVDTRRLLSALSIPAPRLIKYNERINKKIIEEISTYAKFHSVGYVTSAGMPSISDPGSELVDYCLKIGVPVIPIPGVSSLSTSVSVSGFSGKRIVFLGFLPRKKTIMRELFERYLEEDSIVVCFESPFRIMKSLESMKVFFPDMQIMLGREMTKKFESYLRGTAAELLEEFLQGKQVFKGEFTLVMCKNKKSVVK